LYRGLLYRGLLYRGLLYGAAFAVTVGVA
jgi:hypothetical protein